MKTGQLITWETFFLKNHWQNVVEELFPDPFLKIQTWAYLWINILKFYTFYFCLPSWGLSKVIESKLRTTSYKALLKKKWAGTSTPASFSAWFSKKNIHLVTLYYQTKFHCLIVFTSWDIGQYMYCHCLLSRL